MTMIQNDERHPKHDYKTLVSPYQMQRYRDYSHQAINSQVMVSSLPIHDHTESWKYLTSVRMDRSAVGVPVARAAENVSAHTHFSVVVKIYR
jgi:type II secretory pathway component HofQ